MSKFELKDTTAIVTGASRGIGPNIAAALADQGARVALVARSEPELAAVARELREAGATVLEVPGDVTSPEDRRCLVLPAMLSRGRGHIVNVWSMAGRVGFPVTEAYAAAKDGLIGITRVLRGDYRRRGVGASTLILGPVRDAGVGQRTVEEVVLELPPKAFTASPADVGEATVRAIAKDKAEIACSLVPAGRSGP